MRRRLASACFLIGAIALVSGRGVSQDPVSQGDADPTAADTTAQQEADTTAPDVPAATVYRAVIDGAIQPASAEFIVDAIELATESRTVALVIELDTPGGLVDSTRDIIQGILASDVPIIVYVAPGGARAGSAGVFITLAAHVAAMAPGTNIGAATPIQIGGPGTRPEGPAPADSAAERSLEDDSDLDRKVLNDTVAFIRTIAEKRGRNADWAEEAVREASSITETEALEENVIDVIAPTLDILLEEIDGREVEVISGTVTLTTANAKVESIEKSLRFRVLDTIANPNIAFILMLIGIYGIFFELMNPGAILPGVLGGYPCCWLSSHFRHSRSTTPGCCCCSSRWFFSSPRSRSSVEAF